MLRITKSPLFGWWIGIISLVGIVLIQWLVLGFHATTIADTWADFAYLNTHPASLLWDQTSRPLTYLPWVIAYALSSETLHGATAVLVALFAGQAVALYGLFRRLLPESPVLAYCIAAVFVLYPTDVGLAYDGAVNIHTALFLYLLSAWLLLAYWDSGKPLILLFMALSQAAGMLIYELTYPLIFVTPFLLLFRSPRIDKRLLRTAGIWYIAPILVLARMAVLFVTNGSLGGYQSHLLTSRIVDNPLLDMLGSIVRLFPEHFLVTWRSALHYSPFHRSSPLFWAAAATGALALVSALLLIPPEQPCQRAVRRYVALILVGLAGLVLGFLAYVPTSVRYDSFRVFYFTRAGAAISLVAGFYVVCTLFGRYRLPVFVVISAAFVGLASIRFLDLTRVMMEHSLQQQHIVEQIITRIPGVTPGTDFVLLDTSGISNGQEVFIGASYIFASALQMVYDDPSINGHLCLPDGVARGGFNERCELHGGEYSITSNDQPFYTGLYSNTIVLGFVSGYPDFEVELLEQLPPPASSEAGYDPHSHIDPDAEYPPRYYTLIDRAPLIDR